MDPLVVDATVTLPAGDLSWAATRSGGPGGQNVNKVSSKVELRFDLAHTKALADDVKQRLGVLARRRIDREGVLLVTSQRTRDQPKNLEDARETLRQLVLKALEVDPARVATRPSRSAKRRRLNDKAHASDRKRSRARPRIDD